MARDATFDTPLFDDVVFDKISTVSHAGPYFGVIELTDYRGAITPEPLVLSSPVTVP